MLSIEEIEKGCEFADGFSIHTKFCGDIYLECYNKMINMDNSEEFDIIYYPLFLQRVIEGMNKTNPEWLQISQCGYSIQVLTDCNRDVVLNIDLISTNDFDIDQAKEQAIKYILENQLCK